MDTFNQPKIKALTPEPFKQSAMKNCHGFTLIELLVVIAIIAILIGLLLPVIQTKRVEYAANKATQNLTALVEASNQYHMRMGSYPSTIPALVQFCSANPGLCTLDPQLASGRMGGYVFTITFAERLPDDGYNIVAEPEFPGISGSVTLIIDQTGMLTSIATPGSNDARQRAFDNILKSGAKTVVDLLALDSTGDATDQVRAYTGATTINTGTLTDVFRLGDANGDARIDLSDYYALLTTDPAGPTYVPLKAFKDAVSRELRLDTLDAQAGQDIAVTMAELDTTQPSLFSYNGLRNLTRTIAPDFNDDLIAKLDAAEAAEANGNLNRKAKSLKQYRKLVKRQIGTSLTSTNANILNTISTTL